MYLCLSTDFAVEKCSLLNPVEKKKKNFYFLARVAQLKMWNWMVAIVTILLL